MLLLIYTAFLKCIVLSLFGTADSAMFDIDLPPEHMKCFFSSHQKERNACKNSENCPFKNFVDDDHCWGYEKECSSSKRYFVPVCNESSKGWAKSKEEQFEKFFKQGDFGYIQERIEELMVICNSKNKKGSFLECTKYMRFCRGRNIVFDFQTLINLPEPMRYRDDVIREGQVGGHCKLQKTLLKQQNQHKSPLQSWYAEFEYFTEYDAMNPNTCDIYINEPVFVMKLDATVNMYHHFCDFLNLYASLHLNQTFSTDIRILIWDTLPYYSNFEIVWKAFTKHPLMNLGSFKGKKVCFKDAVFPLLPRMIFGMYYNMPLIPGCHGSGLFKAFREHLKHRLKIKEQIQVNKVRVTLISRSTQYRRILNEDELISSLKVIPNLLVRKVNFNRQMLFLDQLEISYNTDILIGIHGAGLTQMLFMPEWGAVFEIFNCEDESCYADLSRLKGLKYFTWEKSTKLYPEDEGHHPTLGAHAKFTNYSFNVTEFLRIFRNALKHVRQHHPKFKGATCNNSTAPRDEL